MQSACTRKAVCQPPGCFSPSTPVPSATSSNPWPTEGLDQEMGLVTLTKRPVAQDVVVGPGSGDYMGVTRCTERDVVIRDEVASGPVRCMDG